MYKKFILKVIVLTIVVFSIIAMWTILVDPFYQYHKPLFGLKPVYNDARYQNPGIAKNIDYDSMLLGSSMTENFRVSQLDQEFGTKTIKLSVPAARTGDYNHVLNKGLDSHNVKTVFLGLDIDSMTAGYDTYFFPLPEYLYDDNKLNDVNYVLNKNVIIESIKWINMNVKGSVPDEDYAHYWSNQYTFSKDAALSQVYWELTNKLNEKDDPSYLMNAKENLEKNIIPHIVNHPDTEFYIFFPPYSVLWWDIHISQGTLNNTFDVVEYASRELLKYDNVRLFSFQSVEEVVTNFNNYKDYNHYSAEINEEMIKWMKNDQFRVTNENVDEQINKLKDLVLNYDFEALLNEK